MSIVCLYFSVYRQLSYSQIHQSRTRLSCYAKHWTQLGFSVLLATHSPVDILLGRFPPAQSVLYIPHFLLSTPWSFNACRQFSFSSCLTDKKEGGQKDPTRLVKFTSTAQGNGAAPLCHLHLCNFGCLGCSTHLAPATMMR